MNSNMVQLKNWLQDMAALIEQNETPDPQHYSRFMQEPELALHLVELIESITEAEADENRAYYSACIFSFEICVAQLQSAKESSNKLAAKILSQLMTKMATAISHKKQTLSFWLPVLNVFYETHVELSSELQNAYFELAHHDDISSTGEEVSHLNSIRDLILELSDISVFDLAEHFFAQSYAMPPDFFADLMLDLYSIDEGQEVALLILIHPKPEVREVAFSVFDQIVDHIILSSTALSRLQVIKSWYPTVYHEHFNHWIKTQRKKGVVFKAEGKHPWMRIRASEVDGTGAQGLFIHFKTNRKNRLCGLLFKQENGIKDAWITPFLQAADVDRYYNESFDDSVMLRDADLSYLLMMTNHFLAITIEQGQIPDLHLLELQEELGLHLYPQKLDTDSLIDALAVQITPFTPEVVNSSLRRSKTWPKNKRFTESWYVENAQVDKLVNRCCSFINGVKICQFDKAITAVFAEELEPHREYWLFHFLWTALWLRAKARKTEKLWQDAFFLAYAIQSGIPLNNIPIMNEICYQSVVNSMETMQERRTHLNQE